MSNLSDNARPATPCPWVVLVLICGCEIHPNDTASDSDAAGSDSRATESGDAHDTVTRDTLSETGKGEDTGVILETGHSGDTDTGLPGTGSLELTCDGTLDDGRAIKLCGATYFGSVGGSGLAGHCDANGDGQLDMVAAYSGEGGVLLITDFSTSAILDSTPTVTGPTYDFGDYPACDGDRDGDGYNDLLASGPDADRDQGTLSVIDGPIAAGMTTDDFTGVMYASIFIDSVGSSAWVSGAGADGGDAVLYGSNGNTAKFSYAYYEDDPVGAISEEDVTAQITYIDVEDLVVGSHVESTDLDGDGVVELVIGVEDDEAGSPSGAINLVSTSESGDVWLGVSDISNTGYGLYGGTFRTGDIDDDGYSDLYCTVSQDTTETLRSLGAIWYGPLSAHEYSTLADAYIDITTSTFRGYDKDTAIMDDFDGDGRAGDLAITYDSSAYLFTSEPSGTVTEADATEIAGPATAHLGRATSLGDLNGDGLDDLGLVDANDSEVISFANAIYVLFGGSW